MNTGIEWIKHYNISEFILENAKKIGTLQLSVNEFGIEQVMESIF